MLPSTNPTSMARMTTRVHATVVVAALFVLHATLCSDRSRFASADCEKGYSYDRGVKSPSPGSKWMSMLLDHTPLSQISYVETHDTMAYQMEKVITTYWAQTQAMTLTEQFASGVRGLDIRCRRCGNGFTMHHGSVYLNSVFGEVLDTVKTFLAANPSETITMAIQEAHTPCDGTTRSFDDIFMSYYTNTKYRNLFWTYTPNNTNPLLREIRGKVVIYDNMPVRNNSRVYGIRSSNVISKSFADINDRCELGNKWRAIVTELTEASSVYARDDRFSKIRSIFVGGSAPDVGSGITVYPWFVASGKKFPDTCMDSALCMCNTCDDAYFTGTLGAKRYKGMNMLTHDWSGWSTSPRHTGKIGVDFPDGYFLQRIFEQNSFFYPNVVYDMRPAHLALLNKCVDIPQNNMSPGVLLQEWDCNQTPAQRFNFVLKKSTTVLFDVFTHYVEIRTAAGLCLGVASSSLADSARIQTSTCSSSANSQKFVPVPVNGGFAFVNVNSKKCIDIESSSGSNGAKVLQYKCHYGANQVFKLRGMDLQTVNSVSTVTVSNGWWGDWLNTTYCKSPRSDGILVGKKMTGYQLRVEAACDGCDDTALNGLRMICSTGPTTLTVAEGLYGDWGVSTSCASGTYIIGARLKLETQQDDSDDTSANSIEFMCSNNKPISVAGGKWGEWGPWVNCPTGTHVCGAQARFEPDQGGNDDTTFNGLRLVCCGTW